MTDHAQHTMNFHAQQATVNKTNALLASATSDPVQDVTAKVSQGASDRIIFREMWLSHVSSVERSAHGALTLALTAFTRKL